MQKFRNKTAAEIIELVAAGQPLEQTIKLWASQSPVDRHRVFVECVEHLIRKTFGQAKVDSCFNDVETAKALIGAGDNSIP